MSISDTYQQIRSSVPLHVCIVIAAKQRSADEIREVIAAGATAVGHNYVQEAVGMHQALGDEALRVQWHMIGPVQTNKINKMLTVCDCVQTVDSYEKAVEIDKRIAAQATSKKCSIYLEINSADEPAKAGLPPIREKVIVELKKIAILEHVHCEGLMTMGPWCDNPDDIRPYFKKTAELFKQLQAETIKGVTMETLSMGMSDSYRVAIEEGANMIRLGSCIFGDRG